MPARVPLDVDLEDKLIYGLTPTRLGYLVLSLLGAFALWSSPWAPDLARAVVCSTVIGSGVVMAWGRWRARATDHWLVDIALFLTRHYCIDSPRIGARWLIAIRFGHRKKASSSG